MNVNVNFFFCVHRANNIPTLTISSIDMNMNFYLHRNSFIFVWYHLIHEKFPRFLERQQTATHTRLRSALYLFPWWSRAKKVRARWTWTFKVQVEIWAHNHFRARTISCYVEKGLRKDGHKRERGCEHKKYFQVHVHVRTVRMGLSTCIICNKYRKCMMFIKCSCLNACILMCRYPPQGRIHICQWWLFLYWQCLCMNRQFLIINSNCLFI